VERCSIGAATAPPIDRPAQDEAIMHLSHIADEFEASAPGTDAFLAVKTHMHALMSSDPAHASAYYLLYGFARSYVILHDDEGVPSAFAEDAKRQLLGYMRQIDAAIPLGPAMLLDVMNGVVRDHDAASQAF